ncbi:MAG: hypothetical protein ICV68_06200, partial [Pyrinomonadaceae bacterium]|nr:hypothetical protein [Pyrinomonadaceae bacterium]
MNRRLLLPVSSVSGFARPERLTLAQARRGFCMIVFRSASLTLLAALFVAALSLSISPLAQAQTSQTLRQIMP